MKEIKITYLKKWFKVSLVIFIFITVFLLVYIISNILDYFISSNTIFLNIIISVVGTIVFGVTLKLVNFDIESIVYRIIHNSNSFNPKIKSLFINQYWKEDYIEEIEKQVTATNEIELLLSDSINNCLLITGEKYTGKTSSIALTLSKLVDYKSKQKLFNKYKNRMYYLSFSGLDDSLDFFIEKYNKRKYEEKFIFLDNISSLSEESISKLYNKLWSGNDLRCSAILLIFDDDHYANKYKKLFEGKIRKSSGKTIDFNHDQLFNIQDKNISDIINNLIPTYTNDTRMVLRHFTDMLSPKYEFILKLLLMGINEENLDVFSRIILLSKVSGHFTYSDLNINDNKKDIDFVKLLISNHYLKTDIFDKKLLILDRKISNFYHTIYIQNDIYREKFEANASQQYLSSKTPILKWLFYIHTNIDDLSLKLSLFFSAIRKGQYRLMLNILEDVVEKDDTKKEKLENELAILYEKNGNNIAASQILNKYSNQLNTNNNCMLFFYLVENNHGHVNYEDQLKSIVNNHNLSEYIRFTANYWLEHIKIEQGIFRYENYHESIVIEAIKHEQEWSRLHEFDYYHLLRRILSDFVRLFYLTGNKNMTQFNDIEQVFKDKLINNHVEGDIYYKVNFVGQKIRNLMISIDNVIFNDQTINEIYGVINLYKEAAEFYDNIGNRKSFYTVKSRLNECQILFPSFNYEMIIEELNAFKEFALNNQIDLHVGYINLIIFKTHFLDFYVNAGAKFKRISTMIELCRSALDESKIIYTKHNNKYSLIRIQLFETIIDFAENKEEKKFQENLNYLKETINDTDEYNRELELISEIQKSKIDISKIVATIKCYPILLQ